MRFFSRLCIILTKPNGDGLDRIRCELLSNIEGNVLELGPGPGTNFRCWANNTKITKWVGVEPNTYFGDALSKEIETYKVGFPIQTVWLNGEDIDIEPESFDFVVGTHVLCSVEQVPVIFKQVSRALKPGGRYLFLEHVQAPKDSFLFFGQRFLQPLLGIVANGCNFKDISKMLAESDILSRNFKLQVQSLNAPVPMSLFVPHIVGIATKNQ